MMKILFYSPMSLGDGAGFQEWLERTLTVLSDSTQRTVICGTLGDRMRWSNEEVENRFSHLAGLTQVSYRVLFGCWCLPSLAKILKIYRLFREQDVIYINHSFRLHDPIPKLLAMLAGKKIVLGFHSPYYKTPGRVLYFYFFARLYLKWVDGCHVINSESVKLMERAGARNVFLIPNFLLKKQLPDKNYASYGGDFVIVGRNERQKGLDLLSPAIRRVLMKRPELKFQFFGSGTTKPIITRLAKKFPRQVKNNGYEIDKNKIYQGRKFLILPSREEPFGLVIIEAMAYGLPVIVSRTSGPEDIVSENEDGWMISELTPDGIERAIMASLAINQQEYGKLSSRAYEKARRLYTEEGFVPEFKKMLTAVQSKF